MWKDRTEFVCGWLSKCIFLSSALLPQFQWGLLHNEDKINFSIQTGPTAYNPQTDNFVGRVRSFMYFSAWCVCAKCQSLARGLRSPTFGVY